MSSLTQAAMPPLFIRGSMAKTEKPAKEKKLRPKKLPNRKK
jgi:hypothetical protein